MAKLAKVRLPTPFGKNLRIVRYGNLPDDRQYHGHEGEEIQIEQHTPFGWMKISKRMPIHVFTQAINELLGADYL